MRCTACRVMITAIIAMILVTGAASAQILPVDPMQPPVVEPPQPPTPTPTVRQPTGVLPGPPVGILPGTPAGEPTVAPTPANETTQTPTQTGEPVQTQMVTPAQPQPPVIAPPGVPAVQQNRTPAPENASAGAGVQISSGPGDKVFPVISGNWIAWFDDNSSSVQLYDLLTGNISTISDATSTPLTLPHELAIGGGYVAWTGVAGLESDIFLYEIASGRLQQVTNGTGMPGLPGVSEDYLIWIAGDELGDVYIYDIATGNISLATEDPYEQLWPDTGGGTFAWADNETEGGDLDIAVAAFGQQGVRLLGDSDEDAYPDVSSDGNHVVWIGVHENLTTEITETTVYLYNVSAGSLIPVTGESAEPDAAAVDGNHVIYSDWRNGNLDIYAYDITTGTETPITRDPYDQSLPDVSDGVIVWMGNNTGQWEIYAAEVPAGPSPTPVPTTPTRFVPVGTSPPVQETALP